jgi:hypothetical protein
LLYVPDRDDRPPHVVEHRDNAAMGAFHDAAAQNFNERTGQGGLPFLGHAGRRFLVR